MKEASRGLVFWLRLVYRNQTTFITDDYLHRYKTLQKFTSLYRENRGKYKHTQTHLLIQEI
jgi:hypothetical protein